MNEYPIAVIVIAVTIEILAIFYSIIPPSTCYFFLCPMVLSLSPIISSENLIKERKMLTGASEVFVNEPNIVKLLLRVPHRVDKSVQSGI